MAATFSITRRDKSATLWRIVAAMTFDSSYPNTGTFATSGYAVSGGGIGGGNIIGAVEVGTNSAALGYVIQFDPAAGNVHVLQSAGSAAPLAEISNATDLHTLTKTVEFLCETG